MIWRHQYRKNKYNAESCVYNGVGYHSKLEAGYARDLDYRKRAGDIRDWERQIKIPLDVHGYHIANYYCDFLIYHNDGTKEYVETKGFRTPVFDLKWKLFEAIFDEDVRSGKVKLTLVQ